MALYEEYVRRSLAGQTGYHRHGRLEAHYYAGKYAYFERRFPEAADHLAATDSLAANSERKRDLAFAVLANLLLGQVHDLAGRREDAVFRYQRVRRLPDTRIATNGRSTICTRPIARAQVRGSILSLQPNDFLVVHSHQV